MLDNGKIITVCFLYPYGHPRPIESAASLVLCSFTITNKIRIGGVRVGHRRVLVLLHRSSGSLRH
jgi:hypothetical protein